jgi:hypothetical protein
VSVGWDEQDEAAWCHASDEDAAGVDVAVVPLGGDLLQGGLSGGAFSSGLA